MYSYCIFDKSRALCLYAGHGLGEMITKPGYRLLFSITALVTALSSSLPPQSVHHLSLHIEIHTGARPIRSFPFFFHRLEIHHIKFDNHLTLMECGIPGFGRREVATKSNTEGGRMYLTSITLISWKK